MLPLLEIKRSPYISLARRSVRRHTFKNPPIGATQIIDDEVMRDALSAPCVSPYEFLAYRAATSPSMPLFYFPVREGSDRPAYQVITTLQVFNICHNLSNHHGEVLQKYGLPWKITETRSAEMTQDKYPVAYLNSSSLNYALHLLFFNRLGLIPLCLSPNNSAEASAKLLQSLGITVLFIGRRNFEAIANAIIVLYPDLRFSVMEDINPISNLLSSANQKPSFRCDRNQEQLRVLREQIWLVMHSSGSTNMPKAIKIPNRYVFANALDYSKSPDLAWMADASSPALSLVPCYHAFGMLSAIGRPLNTRQPCAFSLHFPLAPSEIMKAVEVLKPASISTVPLVLVQLIEYLTTRCGDSDYLWGLLKRVRVIFYGGAPLDGLNAKILLKHGIRVQANYGTTEIGTVMLAPRGAQSGLNGVQSGRMSLLPGVKYRWEKLEGESDPRCKQLIVTADSPTTASGIANRPDGSYATGDVFIEVRKDVWRYKYRLDDQLTHINGEKTNALGIEMDLCTDPLIEKCCVVGNARHSCALLVQLKQQLGEDLPRHILLDKVQELVVKVNAKNPSHSRIPNELIYICQKDETLPTSTKGGVMRHQVDLKFAHVIERLYFMFDESGHYRPQYSTRSMESSQRGEHHVIEIVLRHVMRLLGMDKVNLIKHANESLFDLGLTSVQADQLRNSLMREFGDDLPFDLIYEDSSIERLTRRLEARRAYEGIRRTPPKTTDQGVAETIRLRDKYVRYVEELAQTILMATGFKSSEHTERTQRRNVILITGASGGLASFAIKQLLQNEKIDQIYCLSRGEDPETKLRAAWVKRHLDANILTTALQSNRVRCVSGDLRDAKFGMTLADFKELHKEVTLVIHNGYKMNFNKKINDFESDCIMGMFNIIRFCATPHSLHKRLIFVSSCSSVHKAPMSVVPCQFMDVTDAEPMGYAQSKWVCEQLCKKAFEELGLSIDVVRFAQIGGDTVNGCWNAKEMLPLVLIGGARIKAIPESLGSGTVVPIDVAGAALAEISYESSSTSSNSTMKAPGCPAFCRITHITDPRTRTWINFATTFKKAGLHFHFLPNRVWLQKLQDDAGNPAAILTPILSTMLSDRNCNRAELAVGDACERLRSLRNFPRFDPSLASKCLAYWREQDLFAFN